MCQTVAGVSSDDIGVLVALIQSYEGNEVYGLEDLTGPSVIDLDPLAGK